MGKTVNGFAHGSQFQGRNSWSALPKPILILIMKKLVNLCDIIRFSSVCSSWRSVALQERFYLPRCTPAGFIIDGGPDNSCKTQCFFPWTKIKLCNDTDTLVLHNLLLLSFPEKSECRRSYKGWLVMVNLKLEMVMLNLVSGVRYRLPGVATLPPVPQMLALSKTHIYYSISSVSKAVISSILTCSYSSMCFVFFIYTRHRALAYCKPGDAIWSSIKSTDSMGNQCNGFTDAIYHKGQLFALHETGKIFICGHTATSPEMIEFVASPHRPLNKQYCTEERYLVESGGDFLIILQERSHAHQNSQSFSLSELNEGGIKRNHVYFMADSIHADYYYKKRYDMGEFNLQSSTIGFYPTSFRLTYPPRIWIQIVSQAYNFSRINQDTDNVSLKENALIQN
ncbi:F-box protein At2g26160-like [Durio zibethinus]|uniref:F-box protein At2g26160-like n=1 Tax=Durio zibethinus TaxID=66656 RepID=A0A6P6B4K4_DURZI|nr:F-box protein At2g26160-like [Durio zibethinus]